MYINVAGDAHSIEETRHSLKSNWRYHVTFPQFDSYEPGLRASPSKKHTLVISANQALISSPPPLSPGPGFETQLQSASFSATTAQCLLPRATHSAHSYGPHNAHDYRPHSAYNSVPYLGTTAATTRSLQWTQPTIRDQIQ
jgi:hypothetical protein